MNETERLAWEAKGAAWAEDGNGWMWISNSGKPFRNALFSRMNFATHLCEPIPVPPEYAIEPLPSKRASTASNTTQAPAYTSEAIQLLQERAETYERRIAELEQQLASRNNRIETWEARESHRTKELVEQLEVAVNRDKWVTNELEIVQQQLAETAAILARTEDKRLKNHQRAEAAEAKLAQLVKPSEPFGDTFVQSLSPETQAALKKSNIDSKATLDEMTHSEIFGEFGIEGGTEIWRSLLRGVGVKESQPEVISDVQALGKRLAECESRIGKLERQHAEESEEPIETVSGSLGKSISDTFFALQQENAELIEKLATIGADESHLEQAADAKIQELETKLAMAQAYAEFGRRLKSAMTEDIKTEDGISLMPLVRGLCSMGEQYSENRWRQLQRDRLSAILATEPKEE